MGDSDGEWRLEDYTLAGVAVLQPVYAHSTYGLLETRRNRDLTFSCMPHRAACIANAQRAHSTSMAFSTGTHSRLHLRSALCYTWYAGVG